MPHRPHTPADPAPSALVKTDRLTDLQALVQVAERGNLSAAARQLGVSPSAVSKLMTRLEARLGVQLLRRSTRRVQLTPEGTQLYEHGRRLLGDLDELERAVTAAAQPRGTVRITASTSTGRVLLLPLVPGLLARYPGLSLDLSFTDEVVDLVDTRMDVAVRWGALPPSDMVARRLGQTRQVIVAAPAYLAARGCPPHPAALAAHVRLGWNYRRAIAGWPFRVDGQRIDIDIGELIRVNDGDVMRELAIQGSGLARLSVYHAWADMAAGRLVPVLEDFNTGDLEPIHAVYLGRPDRLPARARAVLDYLQAHVNLRHAEQPLPWGSATASAGAVFAAPAVGPDQPPLQPPPAAA